MTDHPVFSTPIAGCMKWGQWGARFHTSDYQRMIEQCLEMGITSFDHADIYGHYTTEEEFGKALALLPALRDKMQLISKCGIRMLSPNRPQHLIKSYDSSPEHILQSVDNSLRLLQTDYLDLLLIHRPDPLMDPVAIGTAVNRLKATGKIRHFGVSNFIPSQLALLRQHIEVEVNQLEISISRLEPFTDGSLDQCLQLGIRPQAWSPLGGGSLFTDRESEKNKRILAVAELLGEKYQVLPEQVLLNWLYRHPAGINPVMGSARVERLQAAKNANSFSLTREEWFMLWRASTGTEVA